MTSSSSRGDTPPVPTGAAPDWLAVVLSTLATMKFGTIQITVHDRQVTQVEATEKTRFSNEPAKRGA